MTESLSLLQYLVSHQLKTVVSEFAYEVGYWISGHSAAFPACKG